MPLHRRCFVFALLILAGSITFPVAVRAKEPAEALPRAKPAAVGMNDDALAGISGIVAKHIEAGQISGAVTLVAKDGKLVHLAARGLADVEAERKMQDDALFCIASMTKPITAAAVMILADEGKLALDDPVAKYVPQFKQAALQDGARPKREITIRDLLTHTSGLVGSQQNTGTLAETAKAIAARPLGFEPGAKWQYSPGITVCGRVVEVASGQAYEDFLAQRIFEPLGMNDTTFNPTPEQQERIARLYKPGDKPKTIAPADHWLNDVSQQRSPNPSGGLFSTAENMARFYQAILNGGELDGRRIVSRNAVEQMTHIQTGDLVTGFTPGNGWGLGWCVVREPQGVSKMVSPGTFGHGGAFGTQGWVDPQRKMIFVLMIQRTGFGNSDGADLRGAFQQQAVDALK
ncbi:MAG: serine hydrolase domain-containing protein [Pirellulaceae bacterium]